MMSIELNCRNGFDIDALLLMHKEIENVKTMIDKRGKLVDG